MTGEFHRGKLWVFVQVTVICRLNIAGNRSIHIDHSIGDLTVGSRGVLAVCIQRVGHSRSAVLQHGGCDPFHSAGGSVIQNLCIAPTIPVIHPV